MFTAALFTLAPDRKQPRCPSTVRQTTVHPIHGMLLRRKKGDTWGNVGASPQCQTKRKSPCYEKQPTPKGYFLFDSISVTFWKWQNYGWRAGQWLVEVKEGVGKEASECGSKRATWGTLGVMERLCILTLPIRYPDCDTALESFKMLPLGEIG